MSPMKVGLIVGLSFMAGLVAGIGIRPSGAGIRFTATPEREGNRSMAQNRGPKTPPTLQPIRKTQDNSNHQEDSTVDEKEHSKASIGLRVRGGVQVFKGRPLDLLREEKVQSAERVGELLGMDSAQRIRFATTYRAFATKLRELELSKAHAVRDGDYCIALEIPEFQVEGSALLDEWLSSLHSLLTPREVALYWSSGAHRALFVRGFGEHRGRYWVNRNSNDNSLTSGTSTDYDGDEGYSPVGFEYEEIPEWLKAYRP